MNAYEQIFSTGFVLPVPKYEAEDYILYTNPLSYSSEPVNLIGKIYVPPVLSIRNRTLVHTYKIFKQKVNPHNNNFIADGGYSTVMDSFFISEVNVDVKRMEQQLSAVPFKAGTEYKFKDSAGITQQGTLTNVLLKAPAVDDIHLLYQFHTNTGIQHEVRIRDILKKVQVI